MDFTCSDFENICKNVVGYLNSRATTIFEKIKGKSTNEIWSNIEDEVYDVAKEVFESSQFHLTSDEIINVGGKIFPDIIVAKKYGIEVKSAKDWKTEAGSVFEGSRDGNVEYVFLIYGKRDSDKIEFRGKEYSKCIQNISVTHSPRYSINMEIEDGKDFFTGKGIEYDPKKTKDKDFHKFVIDFLNQQALDKGTMTWWMDPDNSAFAFIQNFKELSPEDLNKKLIEAFIFFPEVFGTVHNKYEAVSKWLASQGLVVHNLRDYFSAGGNKDGLPQVFQRFEPLIGQFKETLRNIPNERLSMVSNFWKLKLSSRDEKKKTRWTIWTDYVIDLCKKNKACDISKIEALLSKKKNKRG